MANQALVKVQQQHLKFLVDKSAGVVMGQEATLATQGISPDTFAAALANAILTTPALAWCPPAEVFKGVRLAIRDGIVPDGREGVLVPLDKYVEDDVTKYKSCAYFPMKEGLARAFTEATGAIFRTGVIRENDEIVDIDVGITPTIKVKPCLIGDPGDLIAAWAYLRMKNGEEFVRIFSKADVNKAKGASRARSGPWQTWYERMAEKSVGKSLLNSQRHLIPRQFVSLDDGRREAVGLTSMLENDPEFDDAVVIDGEAEEIVEAESAQTEEAAQEEQPAAAKTRRRRRTKAEMEAARQEEARKEAALKEAAADQAAAVAAAQTRQDEANAEQHARRFDSTDDAAAGKFDFNDLPPIGE